MYIAYINGGTRVSGFLWQRESAVKKTIDHLLISLCTG